MSNQEEYPSSREILYMLGIGTLLVATIISPGLGMAAKSLYKAKRRHDFDEQQKYWRRFNVKLLKRNLRRLQEQKIVEIVDMGDEQVIKLTQKGRVKFLRYKIAEISWQAKRWDRKWRIVLYDISHLKKNLQENFRRTLKNMNFYPIQKSVYLIPYRCDEEIEYLKEYFNIGSEVMVLEISKLENEEIYKQYFGL